MLSHGSSRPLLCQSTGGQECVSTALEFTRQQMVRDGGRPGIGCLGQLSRARVMRNQTTASALQPLANKAPQELATHVAERRTVESMRRKQMPRVGHCVKITESTPTRSGVLIEERMRQKIHVFEEMDSHATASIHQEELVDLNWRQWLSTFAGRPLNNKRQRHAERAVVFS